MRERIAAAMASRLRVGRRMGSKGLYFIEREPLFGLFNRFFPIEWAEFPINDDDASFRQVLEVSDDAVPELTGRRAFDLKCSHALDLKFNCGPLG
jgi:hypothetical protein